MKEVLAVTAALVLLGGVAFAAWDDANVIGVFPYFQSGGDWYTLLVFVNGSEETGDVVHVRFEDEHGSWCSDTIADMYSIRQREQLLLSTAMSVGTWVPVTAGFGWIRFGVIDGGFIHPYCVIYNSLTGSGYVVPASRDDQGF